MPATARSYDVSIYAALYMYRVSYFNQSTRACDRAGCWISPLDNRLVSRRTCYTISQFDKICEASTDVRFGTFYETWWYWKCTQGKQIAEEELGNYFGTLFIQVRYTWTEYFDNEVIQYPHLYLPRSLPLEHWIDSRIKIYISVVP